MAISRRLNDLPQADDGQYFYLEAADGSQVKVSREELFKGLVRAEFLEPEAFAALSANKCVEGTLYCELGDVIDSETAWKFGDVFPIRFT